MILRWNEPTQMRLLVHSLLLQSIAKAWKEFDDDGRMKESDFRDRVVDCAEEMAKFTALLAPATDNLNNRFSERKETEEKGRLLTQAEKESNKKSS